MERQVNFKISCDIENEDLRPYISSIFECIPIKYIYEIHVIEPYLIWIKVDDIVYNEDGWIDYTKQILEEHCIEAIISKQGSSLTKEYDEETGELYVVEE